MLVGCEQAVDSDRQTSAQTIPVASSLGTQSTIDNFISQLTQEHIGQSAQNNTQSHTQTASARGTQNSRTEVSATTLGARCNRGKRQIKEVGHGCYVNLNTCKSLIM